MQRTAGARACKALQYRYYTIVSGTDRERDYRQFCPGRVVLSKRAATRRKIIANRDSFKLEFRAGFLVGILSQGLCVARERAGLPGLRVLDPYAALGSGKGCQYRPISAATIRNTTHKNSKPSIHKLSK